MISDVQTLILKQTRVKNKVKSFTDKELQSSNRARHFTFLIQLLHAQYCYNTGESERVDTTDFFKRIN